MYVTVTKKNTFLGMKLKLGGIIGAQICPTCTSKGSKCKIIRYLVKKALMRGLALNNLSRKPIDQISDSNKFLIPKFERHRCMSKQG